MATHPTSFSSPAPDLWSVLIIVSSILVLCSGAWLLAHEGSAPMQAEAAAGVSPFYPISGSIASESGLLSLDLRLREPGAVSLQLRRPGGEVVYEQTWVSDAPELRQSFDIASLSPGCYIFYLESGRQHMIRTLVTGNR
jgi:hypothetical protein